MKTLVALVAVAVAVTVPAGPGGAQEVGPTYDGPETRTVVEAMVEAHGGMERWLQAPTVSFTNIFYNPFSNPRKAENPWWISREIIEQDGRRVVQEWPLSEGLLAWDGSETWVTNWAVGNYPNFMVHFFYWFTQLPWLTQDATVELSSTGRGPLPGWPEEDKEFHLVDMRFSEAPGVGKADQDRFLLYIDPDDNLLKGYQYWNGWRPQLDLMNVPESEIFGPNLRIHDQLQTVEGLVVPVRMHTGSADGSQVYGHHALFDYSFSKPFPVEMLERPEGAVVDTTRHR